MKKPIKTKKKTSVKVKNTVNEQSGRDPKTGRFTAGHKFSSAPTKWTEEKAMDLADGLIRWMKDDPNHFLIGDYLIEHDLFSEIVAYLSSRYPQFLNHISRAKEIEAHRITMYALANKLNPGMAQWVLAVNHNKHNVQKTEVTGKDGAPLSPPSITIQPVAVKGSKEPQKEA